MEAFWVREPPPSLTLKWLVGYKPRIDDKPPLVTSDLIQAKIQTKSFDKLPEGAQKMIIKSTGLTDAEFFKRRHTWLKSLIK